MPRRDGVATIATCAGVSGSSSWLFGDAARSAGLTGRGAAAGAHLTLLKRSTVVLLRGLAADAARRSA